MDYLINLFSATLFKENSNSNYFCNPRSAKDQMTLYLANNIKHIQILTNGLIDCQKLSPAATTLILFFAESASTKVEAKLSPMCKGLFTFAKGIIYDATDVACITHEEVQDLTISLSGVSENLMGNQCPN